jgi:hypothetical protein
MKSDILLSILNRDNISELNWMQALLPLRLGGLGLMDSPSTAHSAFVAAAITSHDSILSHFPSSAFTTSEFYSSFIESLQFIATNVLPDKMDLYTLDNLVSNTNTTSFHLQSGFTNDLMDKHFNIFNDFLQSKLDHIHLAWFNSVRQSTSSTFLLATPKNDAFIFNNKDFTTALCLRLHITIPMLSNAQACNCRTKPFIDPTGHHLVTGCNEFGLRQAHHSAIERTLLQLFQYCGLIVKAEEQNCFYSPIYNDQKRPDISIFNAHLIGYEKKVILDLSVASPLNGAANGTLQPLSRSAANSFHAANIRTNQKFSKYKTLANNNNLIFIPLIFETSGAIHPLGEKFLKKVAKVGADLNYIPYHIFYNYIMKTLSCAFHRSISSNLNMRISQILIPNATSNFMVATVDDPIGLDLFRTSDCYVTSPLEC